MINSSNAENAHSYIQLLTHGGGVADVMPLGLDVLEIGRTGSGIACPDDALMADRHATIRREDGRVLLSDLGGGSGVWLRLQAGEGRLLQDGDQVWIGSQILVSRREGKGWKIRHHGPDGQLKDSYSIPSGGLFLGRASELVLDSKDSRLSRRHAQVVPEGEGLRLYDRGAHNGTYLKIRNPEELSVGMEFRVSANRFRYVDQLGDEEKPIATEEGIVAAPGAREETRSHVVATTGRFRMEPNFPSGAPKDEPRGATSLAERLRALGGGVRPGAVPGAVKAAPQQEETIVSDGKILLVLDSEAGSISLRATPGQTVLEAVQEAGLDRGEPVDWECGDGGCGVCIMAVVDGAEQMDPPDEDLGEMRTIQITEQVVPDPNKYRLACLARMRGPVCLRKLT